MKNCAPSLMKWFIVISVSVLFQLNVSAQNSAHWSVNPFENKEFVENAGQFGKADINSNDKILFGIDRAGLHMYFTAHGFVFRQNEFRKKYDDKNREDKFLAAKEDPREKMVDLIPHIVTVQWLNANENVQIIADQKLDYYYSSPLSATNNQTVMAAAYKKITYKNLYDNIDVSFYFPDSKEGIEYDIILHPGADISKIQMKYHGARHLILDTEGNINFDAGAGTFIDHAPIGFVGTSPITIRFKLSDKTVSFIAPIEYDRTKELLIDPWIKDPAFNNNEVYDVSYDKYGNVYGYGSSDPFQYVKIDNTGAIKWKYSAATISLVYYGDFIIDYYTGSSYLTEGFNGTTGAQIIKLNQAGGYIKSYPGNTKLTEMWRAAYNYCNKKAVIGAGGVLDTYQACTLDSNLTTTNPVNVFSATQPYVDVSLLSIDNSGSAYMATCENGVTILDNLMVKCPASTLTPNSYMSSNLHNFSEFIGAKYIYFFDSFTFQTYEGLGFNGMAVNNTNLYTYDGATLRQWNKNTGVFSKQVTTATDTFWWAGLDVSGCDTVYAGVKNKINKYDINLNLISSTAAPDTVFDLKLGDNQTLYACGRNFVSAMSITENCTTNALTGYVTSSGACSSSTSGSAAVVVAGGTGNYSYTWAPGGQTSASIAGLTTGVYTVTVKDNAGGCSGGIIVQIYTVNVSTGNSTMSYTVSTVDPLCFGQTGSALVAVSGSGNPYTYSWSNGQTGITASPLIAGSINTISISDTSGCVISKSFSIAAPTSITLVKNDQAICKNQSASLSVAASGGTGNYSYDWNPGGLTGATINISPANNTTYTVTVTDANLCTATTDVTLTVNPLPSANAGLSKTICSGKSASLFASGGTTYSWSPSTGLNITTISNPVASPTTTTAYTVIVTDANGCTAADSLKVNVNPKPIANAGNDVSICFGLSTVLNASGGISFSWTPGGSLNSSTVFNPTATPASTTNYIVTVTDANGCTATDAVLVSVNPANVTISNNTSICPGDSVSLLVTGGVTYQWTPPSGLSGTTLANPIATPTSTTTYSVVVTDSNGCTQEKTVTVTVNPVPVADFSATPTSGDKPLTVHFTNNSTGANFYDWHFGNDSTSILQNPTDQIYDSTGTFYATLVVANSFGCLDSETVEIHVKGLFIPNVFSPNNDGSNDFFKVEASGYSKFHLLIYDRWGLKMFDNTDAKVYWNGKVENSKHAVPDGTYYYILDLQNSKGEKESYKGYVTLIR